MREDVFESNSIPKAVFTFAIPTMLSMLIVIFYNMADTFFVGQTGDANQVAAVSIAAPVFFSLWLSATSSESAGARSYPG